MSDKVYLDANCMGLPLSVEAVNSNISIVGEQIDSAFLELDGGNRSNEGKQEESGEKSDEKFIDVEYGEKVSIRVRPEFESGERGSLTIHLPSAGERDIAVRISNGQIRLQHLEGYFDVETKNGMIQVRDVRGSVTATCANGSISGNSIDAQLDMTTSNGKVTLRESIVRGGSVRSGNGRISLQIKPFAGGSLSLFSGNGRVRLALGDESGCRIRVQTRGRLYNHLDSYSVQTDGEATVLEKGAADFNVLIQNYRGGVILLRYDDFERVFDEIPGTDEFAEGNDAWGDSWEFFRNLFSRMDPEAWGTRFCGEFERELPKFVEKMTRFGNRFGRMGEEMSRHFHESRPHRNEEIQMILGMLREGKISAEEAEKLIRALKGQKSAP
ncbi:MAG TPA: DUF4097 family beta strand repeat-containing protein [Spirochaetia bacterium]|nr:DUF4097 family beta strand repeat-containing protein [Spirochaetia bacterium]